LPIPLLLLLLQAVTAARERLEWRLAVLTGNMEQLLQHVFGLLGRLSEVGVLLRVSATCYNTVLQIIWCRQVLCMDVVVLTEQHGAAAAACVRPAGALVRGGCATIGLCNVL
jgi:hypothetical protein